MDRSGATEEAEMGRESRRSAVLVHGPNAATRKGGGLGGFACSVLCIRLVFVFISVAVNATVLSSLVLCVDLSFCGFAFEIFDLTVGTLLRKSPFRLEVF